MLFRSAVAERVAALEAAKAAKTAAAQKLDDSSAILQQAKEAVNVGRAEVAKAKAKLAKAEAELKTRESRSSRSSDSSQGENAEQAVDPAVQTARADVDAARKDAEDKDETLREISEELEGAERARAEAAFPPVFPSKILSADGRPACAWVARDFGPSGVIGDPTGATREQGLAILDSLATSWVQVLTELHQLRWLTREEPTWERAQYAGHIQSSL